MFEVEQLKTRTDDLSGRTDELEKINRYNSFGLFTPTSDEFQRVDTTFGSFAVSIENVVAYGDGTKLTINVGNPSAATYDGAKLTIEYRRKFDPENPKEELSRQKEHALLKPIKAGSWNPNTVILPGFKPDELLTITVRLTASQIRLAG